MLILLEQNTLKRMINSIKFALKKKHVHRGTLAALTSLRFVPSVTVIL